MEVIFVDACRIDSFLNVCTANNPVYDPNDQKICFIADYTGLPQVWEINRGEKSPKQISFTKDKITFIEYVSDTSDLIFAMDEDGNEKYQLYLLKQDGRVIALTNSPEHIHRYGGSSPDGQWIAWSSNRRNPAYFDIYVQNLESMDVYLVYAQNGIYSSVKWGPDGKSLLVEKRESQLYNQLGILDLLSGQMDWITDQTGKSIYKNPHFNSTGDQLYLLSNKDREFVGLALIDLVTNNFTWLCRENWDFEYLAMNIAKDMLAYTINEDGISKGIVLDLQRSEFYPWETPMGVISNLSFSHDSEKLAYVFNGAAYLPDIWELDLRSFRSERRTSATHSPALEDKLVEPDLICYRSFDNLLVPAFYYRPKHSSGKFPVVLYMHGGPESQSRPRYNSIIQYFVNVGYAVCAPNFRGSTGYGKTYTHLDDGRKRMHAVMDIICLVEWLKVNCNIDSEKVAIMGSSYGGFMTLAAISHYPQYWSAAVSTVGISSIKTFLKTTSPWRRKLREAEYGTVENDGDFFDCIDPINHTDRIISPLMVIHGANDPRVPIQQSEDIVDILKARNHPVIYIRFEDEGHSIKNYKNRLITYSEIADFIILNFGY